MKKLRVTVEGKVYDVLVEVLDEGAPVVAARAPAPSAPPAAAPVYAAPAPMPVAAPRGPVGSGDIACPLSGKLVTIDVAIGQLVEPGAQVATIEAMKMNTYIFAHKAGTVSEILAAAGDGVEEGSVLIRLA